MNKLSSRFRFLASNAGATGLLALAFGAFCLEEGFRLGVGTAARSGPGFLPVVIGGVMILLAALSLLEARGKTDVVSIPFTVPIALVVLGLILFALLLPRVGFLPAGVVLGTLSTLAVSDGLRLRDLVYVAVIVAGSAIIFVYALGLAIPLLQFRF